MRKTKLNHEELNKRASEVFCLDRGEVIYDVVVNDFDDEVVIQMTEVDNDGEEVCFNYLPDMSDRPRALLYLLGEVDSFND